MASAVARTYNGGQRAKPLKLKPFCLQLRAEFQLKYFVYFEYFYHVHTLHLVCDLHASKWNVAVLATACGWVLERGP